MPANISYRKYVVKILQIEKIQLHYQLDLRSNDDFLRVFAVVYMHEYSILSALYTSFISYELNYLSEESIVFVYLHHVSFTHK